MDLKEPILSESSSPESVGNNNKDIITSLWIESKKLWSIAGPAIFSLLAAYCPSIVFQAFGGHLGDVQLAAISIANNVIIGFNFGLVLGMASALDTLCGQAFGAQKYHLLGIYMQRSWIVLLFCSILLLPTYFVATPILKYLGQPHEVAELSGYVAVLMIPEHISFAFLFPLQAFLQSQLKNRVIALSYFVSLVFNILASWLLVYVLDFGVVGAAVAFDISGWVSIFVMLGYSLFGGCPLTWNGFSTQAFSGIMEFVKLSASSGVMLCLEFWYYRILLLMTGYLKNATLALDALSVCMSISEWQMMIPIAFFAATGVRIANELGAGNGKAAKFAAAVSVSQSTAIGIIFSILVMLFHDKVALIFTSSIDVLQEIDQLSYILSLSILFNSIQPVLSGVAVGSGWQATVAYINLGCYYIIGLPLGILLGFVYQKGVMGMWSGMIFGGTAVQTLILAILTYRCDWEKEAMKATQRVEEWSSPSLNN